MSSDRNSPPLASPNGATSRRRSSIAGSFVDMFGGRPSNAGAGTSPPGNLGPITTAAAQAQQRRLSLTTVGLSSSQPQTSPFGSVRSRGDSFSSSNSGTVEESPFEEGDAPTSSVPTSPFARRLSFGAQAMRNMRTSTGNGNANVGQGFDFAENMRTRAERSSISVPSGMPNTPPSHQRAKSVTVMEPAPKEMPKQPKMPDAFQERILKGDFYMD